uniref:Uncharacterized protein n=1 Tax=Chromera velia CCMP2878 TaxID=1169474 RepID=A0A0G4IDU2_9ALVE|eukprot:Cvel_13470.t1-p1 / transcript=Cvel_13470.t1 / gene=Cvel_13470 / organism=Chromera_velia_CCMP2878 / gene_product=hypothetical protein / transcript_product=hypothetical protein / location=Cvel_scaffold921:38581-41085(-) / protein_length=432 / sequence_SO=supercontig / SO=protein_coding / is_pseudo=false
MFTPYERGRPDSMMVSDDNLVSVSPSIAPSMDDHAWFAVPAVGGDFESLFPDHHDEMPKTPQPLQFLPLDVEGTLPPPPEDAKDEEMVNSNDSEKGDEDGFSIVGTEGIFMEDVDTTAPSSQETQAIDEMVVAVSEPVETTIMIIIDWDDTLLPSYFLSSRGCCPISNWKKRLTVEEMRSLQEVSQGSRQLLETACTYSQVVLIITNAEQGWVELSAENFMPEVWDFLNKGGVRILSARSTFHSVNARSPDQWKLFAFRSEVTKYSGDDMKIMAELDRERRVRDGFLDLEAAWEGDEDEDLLPNSQAGMRRLFEQQQQQQRVMREQEEERQRRMEGRFSFGPSASYTFVQPEVQVQTFSTGREGNGGRSGPAVLKRQAKMMVEGLQGIVEHKEPLDLCVKVDDCDLYGDEELPPGICETGRLPACLQRGARE